MSQKRCLPDAVKVGSAVPVVRMLDEDAARAFYLEYLGFSLDWEHRFRPGTPAYLQVSLGDATLHLDGHASPSSPVSQVRLPLQQLDEYCDWLCQHAAYPPREVVDPRGEGRGTEINVEDPSGNLLMFWRT